MRVYALYAVVAGLLAYAWKDWFKSLCGLIVLMAVIEHEDMPKSIMGIQGFNLWNVLFFGVFLAWLVGRRREQLTWDMPRHMNVLLLLYLGVILVGFLRALLDRSHIEDYPLKNLLSEELINTVKWVLPGILLYDGCRTRKRMTWAIVSILAMYFLIAAQVIKRMPFASAFSGGGYAIQHIRTKLCASIGYSSCDMSAMLAGASWAIVASMYLVRRRVHKILIAGAAAVTVFGQALTGGRAGYLAWGATGIALCVVRWRKYLLLAPVVPLLLYLAFPGAAERALTGFGETDAAGEAVVNRHLVTSGRARTWPHIIDRIGDAPVFGYGRLAVLRTGLRDELLAAYGRSDALPHAHNIYLEWLIDNGIVGFIPILAFYVLMLLYSARLFRSGDGLSAAVGGMGLSLILVQLVAGLGAQHFYPRVSTLGMWAGMFLVLRLTVATAPERDVPHAAALTETPLPGTRGPLPSAV